MRCCERPYVLALQGKQGAVASLQPLIKRCDHFQSLQNAVTLEEMRRNDLERALDNEKHKVRTLEQNLSESGKIHQEVKHWKNRWVIFVGVAQ